MRVSLRPILWMFCGCLIANAEEGHDGGRKRQWWVWEEEIYVGCFRLMDRHGPEGPQNAFTSQKIENLQIGVTARQDPLLKVAGIYGMDIGWPWTNSGNVWLAGEALPATLPPPP
ncbi:hypothetical protein K435DRAFT_808867 [Dendrothele bispora CBS 962.96]|uniref:Uncharacterized protein n=1 Tax=Dendrothele bispora (strain CBS 962.96) TaxID=1314807 RepID=A0A4S8L016_DENBC|nr:hypothetical protein K435DRAFT_808867 [Dendrothele bispora CBS 962.96]